MIRTDPGSRSLGSDPEIRFWDPRTCLISAGDVHPRNMNILYLIVFFLDTYSNFASSNIFKIKWSKSEEKLGTFRR